MHLERNILSEGECPLCEVGKLKYCRIFKKHKRVEDLGKTREKQRIDAQIRKKSTHVLKYKKKYLF